MKKSLMSNIKNFVDSNVRQRIDRASHNNSEFFTDDLVLVERHFEDLRQLCVDTEKEISTLLQSVQTNSQIGAYTHNVQAGLNSLSHSIVAQTASSTTIPNASNISNLNHVRQSTGDTNSPSKYQSTESLSINYSNQPIDGYHDPIDSRNNDEEQKLGEDIRSRHKRLPIVRFHRFLTKAQHKLRPDSLMSIPLNYCTRIQTQLARSFLNYEHTVENQCLKPLQAMLEVDIPNVVKLRKMFIKSYNDLETVRAKYNGASQKHIQHTLLHQQSQSQNHISNNSYTVTQNNAQQTNVNKLENLKKELDDSLLKFEQARDVYESEIYGFVCRETELVDIIVTFYHIQADYHQQVGAAVRASLPTLKKTLDCTPRKPAFGTALSEHLNCTGRTIAPVLEMCIHLIISQGLEEEGVFRIPGSSIKVKKLKNAINAWFINLSSLSELESDQTCSTGHSCIVALHGLFKNVVGKPNEARVDSSPEPDELNAIQEQSSKDCEIYLDIHSIAGLLKLYLRELPEPLFTHDLYSEWLSALDNKSLANRTESDSTTTTQTERDERRLEALKLVISKLPTCNYDNLKHLICFLSHLTSNQKLNKMTSTNLAIAMAPSLIWSKPSRTEQTGTNESENPVDVPSLSLSMSSFGISASKHAMLLETLISNAYCLFPGPTDFSLPGFRELSLNSSKHRDSRRHTADRPLKSTSPAGLSMASSSSFSSSASNPSSGVNPSEMERNTRNRAQDASEKSANATALDDNLERAQSASIDHDTTTCNRSMARSKDSVLASDRQTSSMVHRGNAFRSTRPASVQIRREDYLNFGRQKSDYAPSRPVPPVPHQISHQQENKKETPTIGATCASKHAQQVDKPLDSKSKPSAPPVPPPTSLRHQQEKLKIESARVSQADSQTVQTTGTASPDTSAEKTAPNSPKPVSLRGTGTVPSAVKAEMNQSATAGPNGIGPSQNSVRPSVPPPDKPFSP